MYYLGRADTFTVTTGGHPAATVTTQEPATGIDRSPRGQDPACRVPGPVWCAGVSRPGVAGVGL